MKTVLITGISRGLGKSFFDLLCKEDLFLICISRTFQDYQVELSNQNSNIKLLSHDLSTSKDLISKLETCFMLFDKSEEIIFINNAGVIEPIKKIGTIKNEEIENATNINFISPAIITNFILNKNSNVKILNISSLSAEKPIAGWAIYCATKSAMKMFYDVMNKQYENDSKINIHNIDPGKMNTNMQNIIRNSSNDDCPNKDYFINLNKNKQLLEPASVALDIIRKYIEV